ncbi:MAG: hypothetical protein JSR90_00730 [Proteobacteria bacterium]|nr:hypothetical protein [Pseudomonadota bacterium]
MAIVAPRQHFGDVTIAFAGWHPATMRQRPHRFRARCPRPHFFGRPVRFAEPLISRFCGVELTGWRKATDTLKMQPLWEGILEAVALLFSFAICGLLGTKIGERNDRRGNSTNTDVVFFLIFGVAGAVAVGWAWEALLD